MKVNAILFCFLCYASVAIAADDSDDFSLDSSGGLDSNAASHGDDVIDDSPSGSDLFGDSIPEERITNTPTIKAQTESQKPKSSPAPAAPHSVSQPTSSSKPPSLGVTGLSRHSRA